MNSHLTKLIKLIVGYTLYYTGITAIRRRIVQRNKAIVLMYHRVLDETKEDVSGIHPGMFVTTRSFEKHIQYMKKAYTVINLIDLMKWIEGEVRYDKPPCVITFDDGWIDNYTYAFPLLQKYDVPATIFLITEQMGNKQMLTWEHVRNMETQGVCFGSHTANHKVLTKCNEKVIEKELVDSKTKLTSNVSNPITWFCYPKGQYNSAVVALVKKHYSAALTTERGEVAKESNLYTLPRVGIHNDVSWLTPLFACRLDRLF